MSTRGSTTTITQSSSTMSVNWNSFNVAPRETVTFVQPSTSSVALNRIFDTSGTRILGTLNANGQVFLVNPNGIVFGKGAQVNVGGLVASTLDVSDASLSSGKLTFSGNGTGSVINYGTITAATGGYVALLGNHVGNQGTIVAKLGTVALGAGSAVTLNFGGNSLLSMQVDQSTLNNLAANGGLIQADGGVVMMTAGAKDALLASVVNNTGVIEAHTVENHDGTITLLGGMADGTVNVGGTLDASAPNGGNGGSIETSAAKVKVAADATITTRAPYGLAGSWLIDPTDFTVAASGGDMTGATLSSALGSGNVQLMSTSGASTGSGDININDTVSWNSPTTLTLTAQNNINVNQSITATNADGKVSLQYGMAHLNAGNTATYNIGAHASINLQAGNNFITQLGSNGTPTVFRVITSLGSQGSTTGTDLQGINGNLSGNYALGSDIDATATSGWNSGAGFTPIGNGGQFSGTFDGLGHAVKGLTINSSGYFGYGGLFSALGQGGVIRNVGLVNANVSTGTNMGYGYGFGYVGALVGFNYGSIVNSYTTGSVSTVEGIVGGLVGVNLGTIRNSYSTASVTTNSAANNYGYGYWKLGGGLVGYNAGVISNSYATGNVAVNVSANDSYGYQQSAGGLVGYNAGGSVSNSYATGSVSLNGTNVYGGYAGGLIGSSYGTVSDSYSTGAVSSSTGGSAGGLIGSSGGPVTNSFWDVTTSGQSTSAGGTGLTTQQMQTQSTFTAAGWDFANTWVMYEGYTYPLLRSFMSTLTVTANDAAKTYDGTAFSGGNGVTYSASASGNVFGTLSYGGTSQGATDVNAAGYTISAGGLYSNQQGYVIVYQNGTLTVDPKTLTVTGTSASDKVYDGTTTATLTGGTLSGLVGTDASTVTLTQSGTFASKNVGTGISVTATDSLGGLGAGNYVIAQPTELSANITPATLTVSGTSVSNKVYDGTTTAALSGGTLTGVIGSDSVTLTQSGTFASKNVGTGISVTATDSLGGSGAGNYVLSQPTELSANITPATLTVSGTSASNKVYDGTTTAALSGGTLTGVIGSDSVTLTQSGTFASKNVGTGISVTATDSLGGSGAGNYVIEQPTELSANITPATLTVSGTSVNNKVYDGTTTAALSGGTLTGVIGSDAVTLTQSGTFASKNVGTGISVTAADSLGGSGAGNYVLSQPTELSANITPATLTVSGTSASNKVYDGTATATLSGGTLTGVIGSDSVTLTQSGTFASKNVGAGISVTATDSLGGSGAGNYVLSQPTELSADITPATLTVTGTSASNKVYDGTTTATLTGGTLTGVIGSDSVTLTQSGTFASKNVGAGISVTATDSLGGSGAGNYVLSQPTELSANITPATLTVSGTSVSNKVYDGTTTAALSGGTLSGVIGSDSVTLTQSGTFASKNVGTGISVTAADSLGGSGAGNYVLSQPTELSANITPATLTVTGTSASNKVYDGTTTAALSGGTLTGVIGSDSVTLTQSGTFASKNVGAGISVTATDSLGGSGAGNYVLSQPTELSANITPATLTVSGTSASNKVYDGTTTAALTGGTLSGVIGSDSVTLTQSGTFASKNVGTGISVTATDSLSGSGAGNYVIEQPTELSANITPATLTVSGTSVSNKVYDGTTTAALSGGTLTGVIGSDSVTLTQSGAFASKNVGTGISVTATDSLGGSGSGNYVLSQPTQLSANITPATLTVSGTSATNKVYDGTRTATLSGGTLTGVIGSDSVTLTQSGTFASKNVGTGISVTATDSLGGSGAGNYVLSQPTELSANITPATLTVSGTSVSNKVYDGTTTAALSGGTLTGVIGSDSVTLTQSGTFASKNVGTGISVTATDSLGGSGAGNYVIEQPTELSANITPATLTVNGTSAGNKVYDGTTTAALSGGTLTGVIGSDSVTLTQSGTFASKNVGTGISVTAADSLGGSGAGNYVLSQPTELSANITPATLTVSGTSASNKVYDGTTTATLSGGTLSGVIGSDSVTLTQSGTFASKNVGTGISVTATDSLGGSGAGNYVIEQPTELSANITPATLTVSGTNASNKVYDGTTTATLTGGTLSGVIGSDSVTLTQSGTFASKNVGTGISVSASDALSGADANNYVVAQPTDLTASITPATLTYTAAAAAGTAGQPAPTLTGTLSGFVGDETQASATSGNLAWTTTATRSSAAGTYAIDGGGLTAANYVFAEAPGNATALTLAAAPLNSLPDVLSSAQTGIPVLGGTSPSLNPSSTITNGAVPPNSQPGAPAPAQPGDQPAPSAPVPAVTMNIGGTGTLRIENKGVNLPAGTLVGQN
nr:YDG domain-containing protein [Burkholderia sp. SRS-W-2-2016]